eukprot:13496212-Alexandrium_andersonii.AAC.1
MESLRGGCFEAKTVDRRHRHRVRLRSLRGSGGGASALQEENAAVAHGLLWAKGGGQKVSAMRAQPIYLVLQTAHFKATMLAPEQ